MKLGEVLEISDSGIWGDVDPSGVSVLRSTNFRNDGTLNLLDLTLRAIPQEKLDFKLLKPGDILLERSGGGPQQPVGRVCLFMGDKQDHTFGNFCQRLRTKSSICDTYYLFLNLYFFHLTGQTQLYQKQTIGIRNLEYKRYLSHEIPLPPLPEQKRIAAILKEQMSAVDKARKAAEERLAAVKALPAAFLRHVFPQPGQHLPEGWRWVKLGEITNVVNGTTPPSENKLYWNGNIVWITPTDLGKLGSPEITDSERRITSEGFEICNLTLVPPGTVVMSSRAPIGHLGIATIELCTNQGCKSFVPGPEIDTHFLYYALKISVPKLKELGSGATFSEVSKSQCENFDIPLPSLSEQKHISSVLQDQIAATEKARVAAEEELATINSIPAAILRKAFNGEI